MSEFAHIIGTAGIGVCEAARRLGISTGYAADLNTGKRNPSLALARRIEEEFGVEGLVDRRVSEKMSGGAQAA